LFSTAKPSLNPNGSVDCASGAEVGALFVFFAPFVFQLSFHQE
jgi:hypothetical protein